MDKITYKDAGVSTKEGERAVGLMKEHVKKTFNENVLTGLGGFGGLFKLPIEGMKEPVLVSGTDGVGTKLKIAFMLDKHDTVGIDCVAMCVNDILCQGATPLFFLDYIATGKVTGEKIAQIVKGISEGCLEGESALIGGETAEMPGFYEEGEYDMAGFSVGVVDRDKIITGQTIKEGNIIIGLPSSGIHSNGYSLVRKILFEKNNIGVNQYIDQLGETLGEALIRPTKIYVKALKEVVPHFDINGIVHITGGGFYENVPRVLPEGLAASFQNGSWKVPKIFTYMKSQANIDEEEMFKTFNMGIGMMLFVDEKDEKEVINKLKAAGEEAISIGKVVKEEKERVIINGKA